MSAEAVVPSEPRKLTPSEKVVVKQHSILAFDGSNGATEDDMKKGAPAMAEISERFFGEALKLGWVKLRYRGQA